MRQELEIFPASEGLGFAAVRFASPGLTFDRVRVGRRLVRPCPGLKVRAWLPDVAGSAWVCSPAFARRHLETSGQRQPIPRGIRIFLGHE